MAWPLRHVVPGVLPARAPPGRPWVERLRAWPWSQTPWVQIPVPPLGSYDVASPQPYDGASNSWGLKESLLVEGLQRCSAPNTCVSCGGAPSLWPDSASPGPRGPYHSPSLVLPRPSPGLCRSTLPEFGKAENPHLQMQAGLPSSFPQMAPRGPGLLSRSFLPCFQAGVPSSTGVHEV